MTPRKVKNKHVEWETGWREMSKNMKTFALVRSDSW